MSLLDLMSQQPRRFDGDAFGTKQVRAGSARTGGATLCDRLAAHFKARPGVWIDGRELAEVAGAYAWRSRVSDLRREPYYMAIENRQRKVDDYTISEYRYAVPDAASSAEAA